MAEDEQDEEMTNGDSNNDVSRDLAIDEHIKDPVEDRRTLAERNERLHDQLKVRLVFFFINFCPFQKINASLEDVRRFEYWDKS